MNNIKAIGILNVSPESFSGDGSNKNIFDRAEEMIKQGADIIDVGAQSTRPGEKQISLEEEISRIKDIIAKIHGQYPQVGISIDTTRYEVAQLAIKEGANMINDISGGKFDPKILTLVASNPKISFVLTHSQGVFDDMHKKYEYKYVIEEIKQYFLEHIDRLLNLGVKRNQIILDPGIGFSKGHKENIEIIKRLNEFKDLKLPIYVGLSRKKFIGTIVDEDDPKERDLATALLQVMCIKNGAAYIRTHNVKFLKHSIKILKDF